MDAINQILNDFKVWCYRNRLRPRLRKCSFAATLWLAILYKLGKSYITVTSKSTSLGAIIDRPQAEFEISTLNPSQQIESETQIPQNYDKSANPRSVTKLI